MTELQKSVVTIIATAVMAAGLVALGYVWGGQAEQLKNRLVVATDRADATDSARKSETAAVIDVNNRGAAVEKKLSQARGITKTIYEKVPVYVPYTNDVADRVSVGLARLHDAAAAGDASLLSTGPGELDGTPSAFAETDLAFAIAGNYGELHECQTRLTGLQDHELARLAFEEAQRQRLEGRTP